MRATRAGQDHVAADRWEIAEPGYWSGDLPVGGEIVITVSGTALSAGALVNTAIVAPADADVVDPEPANNTSSASVTVSAAIDSADPYVVHTTSTPAVEIGDAVEFQIVAGNHGPNAVTDAQFSDLVPAAIDTISWTCTAAGGAQCGPGAGAGAGTGNDVLRQIATLGGLLARKGDGEPGAETIWLGLQRTRDAAITIQSLREESAGGNCV